MVIFHSYVSLPEGTISSISSFGWFFAVHGWTRTVLAVGISDADGSAESPGHLLPGVRGPDSRSTGGK